MFSELALKRFYQREGEYFENLSRTEKEKTKVKIEYEEEREKKAIWRGRGI